MAGKKKPIKKLELTEAEMIKVAQKFLQKNPELELRDTLYKPSSTDVLGFTFGGKDVSPGSPDPEFGTLKFTEKGIRVERFTVIGSTAQEPAGQPTTAQDSRAQESTDQDSRDQMFRDRMKTAPTSVTQRSTAKTSSTNRSEEKERKLKEKRARAKGAVTDSVALRTSRAKETAAQDSAVQDSVAQASAAHEPKDQRKHDEAL